MKKWVDDSFETYEGKISEFLDEKPKWRHRAIFMFAVPAVLLALLFAGATVRGRAWTAAGAAIVMQSLHDTLGLSAHDSVVRDVADASNADPSADDGTTSSTVDAAASGTVDENGSFPSVLPVAPAKSKRISVAKPSKSEAASQTGDASMDEGEVLGGLLSQPAGVILPAAAKSTAVSSVPIRANPGTVYPVSAVIQGDGRGMVTSTPSGISCDGAGMCTWNFAAGSSVALHATHDTMSSFGGWSGACSGTAATCTFTADGPASVTAIFRAKAGAATPPGASASVAPPIIVSSATVATSTDVDGTSPVVSTVVAAPSPADSSAADAGGGAAAGNGASTAASLNHVVVAAVQIAGDASTNDFVKLYNPTNIAIDVGGWKLHKKSSTGADYSLKAFAAGTAIPAGGYLVWANSANGFSDAIGADAASTQTLAAGNSVALFDASGARIDAVAWGSGADQYAEGGPYPTDPGANQVLARKTSGGAVVDTDNNADDFTVQ